MGCCEGLPGKAAGQLQQDGVRQWQAVQVQENVYLPSCQPVRI